MSGSARPFGSCAPEIVISSSMKTRFGATCRTSVSRCVNRVPWSAPPTCSSWNSFSISALPLAIRPDGLMSTASSANEDASGQTLDNESLEFLGDAVLGFVIADLLFGEFPQLDEGRKSKIKASLVSTQALGDLARELGLGQYLALGRGEEKTGGRHKQALLADSYEALIAAIYLDGGMDAARAFILRAFAERLEDVRSPEFWGRDYKSGLQEVVQARELPLPEYVVASESGPDHRKVFHVEVRVAGETMGTASGASKKAAEQEAARQALERLED